VSDDVSVTFDQPISELLGLGRPLRSVEFFPPRDDAGVEALMQTAAALRRIRPDFVSVTYGAGGSTRDRTAAVSSTLRHQFGFTVMPHLTAVNHTRAEIAEVADEHFRHGIRNIMALRGDVPKGVEPENAFCDGLRYGSDVVAVLRRSHPEFCLGVGGYPETHPEAPSAEADLENLRRKVDAGASFITTQLFFENSSFYGFVDRCRAAGIGVPIIPGIMPVLSLRQITRIVTMCGASLPDRLVRRLDAAGDQAEIAEAVGIDWALAQIRDLLEQGVPGYHLYVLNRARAALALAAGLAA
jgi:methylenetetrahydrofolate reductase (NADPH)